MGGIARRNPPLVTGEIRRWLVAIFATGEIRRWMPAKRTLARRVIARNHWQISPVDQKAISPQRAIIPATPLARDDARALQRVEMVPDRLFALARVLG